MTVTVVVKLHLAFCIMYFIISLFDLNYIPLGMYCVIMLSLHMIAL